jgi:phosphatidylserine/phosphatidylglycerophosphate/cardiolipin synthase-like enzyme
MHATGCDQSTWLPARTASIPPGIGDSQAELVRLISQARQEVRVEVMEYAAVAFGGAPYTVIDDALRAAAARGVRVGLRVADLDLTAARIPSLRSLVQVPNVELRVIKIPESASGPIPYSRVVHTKVMTIDGTTGWVGTSNWEGGYLDNSRNVEVVLHSPTLVARLAQLQDQAWASPYVKALEPAIAERQAQPRR